MAAPTENDIKDLQDQIQKLNDRLDEMSDNMDKIDKKSASVSKNIGDSNDLLKDAVLSVKNISTEFRKFATDSQAQYKYAEELAKESKQTAINIGISVGRSKEFTKSFNRATAEVQKFGGSASDVSSIMEEFAENSGRARIISPEEVSNIFLLTKGLNLTNQSAGALVERMDLMGVSVDNSNKLLNSLTVESQKLGLNASQVAKTLANNFDQMSSMSFKGGVKGMTQMAKLAVQMRMDVSDMLQMAEKFYEPEAAIEAVANLQMLGGDVAEAFGDPFETMYLARNKPEELAKKVQTMTENMIQFNEETGEYEFPAEARMQLKAAGEQLGVNVDSMIEIARQSSKIKDIKMNVSGNIQDEDMRDGLASMAKMKDGKWVVDFDGKEVGIEDIGVDLAEKILAAPKNEEEAIMDLAYNSMTTNQILSNILEAMKTGYVAESNVYELTEDIMRPGLESLLKGAEDQVTKTIEYLQTTPYGNLREMMLEQAEKLGLSTGEGVSKIFEGNFAKDLAEALKNPELEMDVEEILKVLKTLAGEDVVKGAGENEGKKVNDFMLRSSGEITSFSNEDDVIGAKKGGPLDKLMDKSMMGGNNNMVESTTIEFGNLNITGRIELVSPDGSTNNIDMASIKPMVEKTIISHLNGRFRNGGVPSSKEATDYMAV
jgi:methyl-accepting chemotaxis protein